MRLWRNAFPGAAALALLALAACGQDETPGAGESAVRGVSRSEIVLGTHQDLSGPIVSWGVSARNGMIMALEEVNAQGGVHGRKLRLLVEDTGYEPGRAVLVTRKLLDRDGIFAMIGALGSPTVLASMPLVLRKNTLHLFPFTAAEGTYEPFHPLKFASNTPYKDSIRVGVRHLIKTRGVRRAGILYQDDDFGLDVRRGTEAELAAQGLAPAAVTSYKRGATDFTTQIARLKAAGADFVVMGTVIRETVGAMKAARALDWNAPFLCSQACYTPETADLGGAAVAGLYATGQIPVPYADDPNSKLRDWLRRYEARFPVQGNVQALTGYTIMRLFVEGLRRAGPEPTAEKVARALEEMPSWVDPDVGGAPIDYTPQDHLGVHTAFVARIENGRWRTITDLIEVEIKE